MTKLNNALLLTVVAFASLVVYSSADAQACSAPIPGMVHQRQIIPKDGATSVPTNARIVVVYRVSTGNVPDHPRLQTAAGTEVPVVVTVPASNTSGGLSIQTYVMTPAAPLAPDTKYVVLSDYGVLPCILNPSVWLPSNGTPTCSPSFDGGVAASALDAGPPFAAAVSSFTTGQGTDETAPAFSGALGYAVESRQTCDNSPCCGPFDVITVGFNWNAATDDQAVAYYELSAPSGPIMTPVMDSFGSVIAGGSTRLVGAMNCAASWGFPAWAAGALFSGSPGTYSLVAVDVAGNRSQALNVNVEVDCTGRDGGTDTALTVDLRPELPVAPDATERVGRYVPPEPVDIGNPDQKSSGVGGAIGSGGAGGSTSDVYDAAAVGPKAPSESGCSCDVGRRGSAGTSLAMLAIGLMVAFGRRRTRL